MPSYKKGGVFELKEPGSNVVKAIFIDVIRQKGVGEQISHRVFLVEESDALAPVVLAVDGKRYQAYCPTAYMCSPTGNRLTATADTVDMTKIAPAWRSLLDDNDIEDLIPTFVGQAPSSTAATAGPGTSASLFGANPATTAGTSTKNKVDQQVPKLEKIDEYDEWTKRVGKYRAAYEKLLTTEDLAYRIEFSVTGIPELSRILSRKNFKTADEVMKSIESWVSPSQQTKTFQDFQALVTYVGSAADITKSESDFRALFDRIRHCTVDELSGMLFLKSIAGDCKEWDFSGILRNLKGNYKLADVIQECHISLRDRLLKPEKEKEKEKQTKTVDGIFYNKGGKQKGKGKGKNWKGFGKNSGNNKGNGEDGGKGYNEKGSGKSNVQCYGCGGFGHTRKDCPTEKNKLSSRTYAEALTAVNTPPTTATTITEADVYAVWTVRAEDEDAKSALILLDTGCVESVCGSNFVKNLKEKHPELVKEYECQAKKFQFGAGTSGTCFAHKFVHIRTAIGIQLKFYMLEGAQSCAPPLMSLAALGKLGTQMDLKDMRAYFANIGQEIELQKTPSGHLAWDIMSNAEEETDDAVL